MEIKTNITIDKKTVNTNGRDYKKAIIINELDKIKDKDNVLIYSDSDSISIRRVDRVIGRVNNYIIKDNKVFLEGKFFKTPEGLLYENTIGFENISVAPYGIVKHDVDGNITDFHLVAFNVSVNIKS